MRMSEIKLERILGLFKTLHSHRNKCNGLYNDLEEVAGRVNENMAFVNQSQPYVVEPVVTSSAQFNLFGAEETVYEGMPIAPQSQGDGSAFSQAVSLLYNGVSGQEAQVPEQSIAMVPAQRRVQPVQEPVERVPEERRIETADYEGPRQITAEPTEVARPRGFWGTVLSALGVKTADSTEVAIYEEPVQEPVYQEAPREEPRQEQRRQEQPREEPRVTTQRCNRLPIREIKLGFKEKKEQGVRYSYAGKSYNCLTLDATADLPVRPEVKDHPDLGKKRFLVLYRGTQSVDRDGLNLVISSQDSKVRDKQLEVVLVNYVDNAKQVEGSSVYRCTRVSVNSVGYDFVSIGLHKEKPVKFKHGSGRHALYNQGFVVNVEHGEVTFSDSETISDITFEHGVKVEWGRYTDYHKQNYLATTITPMEGTQPNIANALAATAYRTLGVVVNKTLPDEICRLGEVLDELKAQDEKIQQGITDCGEVYFDL